MTNMKSPSFWLNFLVSVGLFALIFTTYEVGMRFQNEPAVHQEVQLTLEDHNQQIPLEESEPVAIPPAPTESAPVEKTAEAIPAVSPKKPKHIAKVPTAPASTFRKPDPFTNGGPMDLDRNYLTSTKIDQSGSAEVYQLARTSTNKRDYFIPFEK